MRYAVLSDIHANLEALDAVLADIAGKKTERIVCLGDVVGYGADPGACLQRIMACADVCVAGNHDRAIAEMEIDPGRTAHGGSMLRWSAEQLPAAAKARLGGLDLEHVEDGLHFVHGSPQRPGAWTYLLSPADAAAGFAATSAAVIFAGHTHVPAVFAETAVRRFFGGAARDVHAIVDSRVTLHRRHRYIFNPGSVGQPRDGDPRAAYAVFDSDAGRYQLYRVAYDIARAAGKIQAAGLPRELAERLQRGR